MDHSVRNNSVEYASQALHGVIKPPISAPKSEVGWL